MTHKVKYGSVELPEPKTVQYGSRKRGSVSTPVTFEKLVSHVEGKAPDMSKQRLGNAFTAILPPSN